eukprot:2334533-Prymnesium_polylepis.1
MRQNRNRGATSTPPSLRTPHAPRPAGPHTAHVGRRTLIGDPSCTPHRTHTPWLHTKNPSGTGTSSGALRCRSTGARC